MSGLYRGYIYLLCIGFRVWIMEKKVEATVQG